MSAVYIVCDRCGSLNRATLPEVDNGPKWTCDDCGSEAAWMFSDASAADRHSFLIQQRAAVSR